MLDGLNEDFKMVMRGWHKTNLLPIYDQTKNVIGDLRKKEKIPPEYMYWWTSYVKNSIILFEIMMIDKYSNQSAFTMRILMEISADVLFMSAQQENIERFRKHYIDEARKIKNCSYSDFVIISKKLKMFDYDAGKEIETRKRIQLAFGKEGVVFYDYLCCYTHLNYIGVIKDIDTTIDKDGELEYRLEFVKYYPDTFSTMIRALEIFSGESDLFDKIDTKKMRRVITDLVEKHSLGKIE